MGLGPSELWDFWVFSKTKEQWLRNRRTGVQYTTGHGPVHVPDRHFETMGSCKKEYRKIETLNYRQASRIMELEQELRMVKNEAIEATDNVLDFIEKKKALTMAGGGTTSDVDWLSPMKVGTEFLVRPKVQKTWVLAKFMHAGCKDWNVLVIPMKGEEVTSPESEWIWVDPVEFCKFWDFKGILLEPINE